MGKAWEKQRGIIEKNMGKEWKRWEHVEKTLWGDVGKIWEKLYGKNEGSFECKNHPTLWAIQPTFQKSNRLMRG